MRFVFISFLSCLIVVGICAQTAPSFVSIEIDNASTTVAGDPSKVHRLPLNEKTTQGSELRINANFDKITAQNPNAVPMEDYLLSSSATFTPKDPDLLKASLLIKGATAFQLNFGPTIRVWLQHDTNWVNVTSSVWIPLSSLEEISLTVEIEGIDGSRVTNDTVLEANVRNSTGSFMGDRALMTVVKTEFMLSFDDGPVVPQTAITLNALSQIYVEGKPVRSIFFMVGESGGRARFFDIWASLLTGVKSHPELVSTVLDAGHFVGNHTAHHAGFTESWTEADVISEIQGAETELRKALGSEDQFNTMPKLFRSPYLQDLPFIQTGVQKCGYQMVWGKANLGESNPFLKYEDIKKLSREYLEHWNTRENPSRKLMPTLLIYHELHNDIAKNIQEIVAILRNAGFVLRNFDPTLCYANKNDY